MLMLLVLLDFAWLFVAIKNSHVAMFIAASNLRRQLFIMHGYFRGYAFMKNSCAVICLSIVRST